MTDGVLHILIVENDAAVARLAGRALESHDPHARVTTVSTLADARRELEKTRFGLVLTDLILPDGRGTDLLRPDGAPTEWPVIVMTGQGDEQTALAAIKAGATDYVVKDEGQFGELHRTARRATREWDHLIARRRAEEGLRESERRYRLLAENVTDVIWTMDMNLRFTYTSPSVKALRGYTPEEAMALPLERTLTPPSVVRAHRVLAGRLEEIKHRPEAIDEAVTFDVEHFCKDGSTVWAEVNTRFLTGLDGKPIGVIGVTRDITRRRVAEQQLDRYRLRLEERVQERTAELLAANQRLQQEIAERKTAEEAADRANEAKSRFLANMSHELRTPLHSILSFATFGMRKARNSEPATMIEYFETIERSGNELLDLVNDLLDLATLESGDLSPDYHSADLHTLVIRLVDEFNSLGSGRRVSVECVCTEDNVPVTIDPNRLAQVLRHLLSNALKFSPDGGRVRVLLESGEETARVTVSDEGPGVPPDELKTIFNGFVESSKTATGAGGTGLGLAICRKVVLGHGGHIWAENRPAGGAEFIFEIPRQPTEIEPAAVVGVGAAAE